MWAHLFMGHEALAPAVLKRELAEKGLTKDELAVAWKFDPSVGKREPFLLAETRRRILFAGDQSCHQRAKKVSDGFEHGFDDFPRLRAMAREIFETAAKYLRTAIIATAGVDERTSTTLNSFPEPRGQVKAVRYLWGHLVGEADELAAAGQAYPICKWASRIKEIKLNENARYTVTYDETLTVQIGEGLRLRSDRFEVWTGLSCESVLLLRRGVRVERWRLAATLRTVDACVVLPSSCDRASTAPLLQSYFTARCRRYFSSAFAE